MAFHKSYGKVKALEGVSFSVGRAKCLDSSVPTGRQDLDLPQSLHAAVAG